MQERKSALSTIIAARTNDPSAAPTNSVYMGHHSHETWIIQNSRFRVTRTSTCP